MQLLVVAVGQRMPSWVQEGWQEYARRFPRGLSLDLREVPLARRGRNAVTEVLRAAEADALLGAVPSGYHVVALDERGQSWSTRDLAQRLEGWMRDESGVAFLIGGPDGLDERCRQFAREQWSLSRLTLPHAMVRPLLAEQLYRAWTVLQNHPYHRD